MPEGGVEPPWAQAHCVLNAACLPFPPLRQSNTYDLSTIIKESDFVKLVEAPYRVDYSSFSVFFLLFIMEIETPRMIASRNEVAQSTPALPLPIRFQRNVTTIAAISVITNVVTKSIKKFFVCILRLLSFF